MFYRKYRPQTWEDLDSKAIRETLGKAVLANDWSHAYLLTGTRGSGKTTTARLIAKTVNCLNRKKGEEPCNKCDSCKAITASNSLDVIEIDAASNTGVDDIRDLREKVKLAPTASKYKVYIIDEVHMLSTSAFNALLKTLEEPPEHVIFVLATTDPQKLPETIVSRCLVYDFGRVSPAEIKSKLAKIAHKEAIKVEEAVLTSIVERATGSHRDAQKLLEQLKVSGAKMDLASPNATNLLNFLLNKNREKALAEIAKLTTTNIKIKDLIAALISLLRDNLLSGIGNRQDDSQLIIKLMEATSLLRDCPIPQLPLELLVVEWCREDSGPGQNDMVKQWPEIVAATKQYNHSLMAFLKASRPKGWQDDVLVVEVFYKFHKEKLEEKKNRDILEKVASDIMGKNLKIKFELGVK